MSVLPSEEDIHDLATDVTVVAMNAFREDVLVPGRWHPARGATLATFFVGQCLFHFPLEYRTWLRAHRRSMPVRLGMEHALPFATEHLTNPTGNPAVGAELNILLGDLRRQADNDQGQDTQILLSSAVGFEHEEIGKAFGLPSTRSVEGVCYRRRAKLR